MLFGSMEDFQRRADGRMAAGNASVRQLRELATSAGQHAAAIAARQHRRAQAEAGAWMRLQGDMARLGWPQLARLGHEYLVDAWQRAVLTADILRERGNNFEAHEDAGAPPLLYYDYEVIMDGRDLKRPVNYMLLSIRPPAGVEVLDWRRPYLIIDPRAGHGAGIGGFKPDSQVGVAMRGGHAVYFVAFRQHPEAGQTLADVMRAEAAFYKEIVRRHPKARHPVVVGNCQGGWATLLLAAANPDITGPIVINGAPLATWSGVAGENPMRYSGGLLGGALPAMVISDLGCGEFDGAHLVFNFEKLNPSRSFFRKYFDIYVDPERTRERFLEFERWWGGFYFLNENEIHWILDNIFIGNRLSRGEARIERGRSLDLKAIRAPIIVFASHGDNITPPQQALNWIVDTYADEREIKIRGQRIIYMVHESVGHLGIFVSSSTARKEHSEIVSVLRTIESLAPGLYEMVITEQLGEGVDAEFAVEFEERRMADILALDPGGRDKEDNFGAVARLSELAAESYDMFGRPFVRALATPTLAQALQNLHPLRLQRRLMSDRVPGVARLGGLAATVRNDRRPVDKDNPFRRAEVLAADTIERWMDAWRDVRDAWCELAFLGIYANPFMRAIGESHNFHRTLKDKDDLRYLPEVQSALANIGRGGIPEAVIRMLVLVAEGRGAVRASRVERAAYAFEHAKAFADIAPDQRARIFREQTLIIQFEHDGAIARLADLLPDMDSRAVAMAIVEHIVGLEEQPVDRAIETLEMLRQVLELPPLRFGEEIRKAKPRRSKRSRSTTEAA
jgi:pimeloyl-ACP methyl ester carboxylesterase